LGILSKLFSDPEYKAMVLHVPTAMDHALETVTYLNDVNKEEIILTALDEYLRKNLWSTKETGKTTEIKRLRQLRK